MPCPPECERTGMCVRACVPVDGPICPHCMSGDCNECDGSTWDDESDCEPMLTYCRCCGDPEF